MTKIFIRLFLFILFFWELNTARAQTRPETMRQIQMLVAEKKTRTGTERKISSQLLQGLRESKGRHMVEGVNLQPVHFRKVEVGDVEVEIVANVTDGLISKIKALGAKVIFASVRFHTVQAQVSFPMLETIAGYSEVKFIKPASPGHRVGRDEDRTAARTADPMPNSTVPNMPGAPRRLPTEAMNRRLFDSRIEKVKQKIGQYIYAAGDPDSAVDPQGDHAHGADLARSTYGYEGQGIRIGVLGDSYNSTRGAASDVLTGALPGKGNPAGDTIPVTVLEDVPQNYGTVDEGRAMLQIVHKLAPKARLFYATPALGEADYASNMLALRSAPYNCDIIVDDYYYYDEPVFQDGILAQAVNSITASGGMYFTSAGNSGSVAMGSAGIWEGDFNDAGSPVFDGASKIGTIHNFGTLALPEIGDSIIYDGNGYLLSWADPLGGSSNDYDLFLVDSNGNVKLSLTDIQDGTQDPVEVAYPALPLVAGDQLVVFKSASAAVRAFDVNTIEGALKYVTVGATHGHFAAAPAFTVAATDANAAYPNRFSSSDQVEFFSSDGPRRMFFNADTTAITPGNFLFGTNGGSVRNKPDFTAADGVSTTLSDIDLKIFYGTSAAGPHAAAIAALLKSANPALTPAQIGSILKSTALDIEAPGYDNNSGYGILQAFPAMQSVNPAPIANIAFVKATATEGAFSNHNGILDPGETANLAVALMDPSLANAASVSAILSTTTPGVTVLSDSVYYGSLSAGATSSNSVSPFSYVVNSSVKCNTIIHFSLLVKFAGSGSSPAGFVFTIQIPSYCTVPGGACAPIVTTITNMKGAAFTGKPFKQTITASGGSNLGLYTYAVSGVLPNGITLVNDSLVGVPTLGGTFPLTINVTDPAGCTSSAISDTLKIKGNVPTLSIAQGSPQTANSGQPFAALLTVEVADTAKIPLSGIPVLFTSPVDYASTIAGGYFGSYLYSATVLTDNNGMAAAPVFTANGYGGSYKVAASISGIPSPAEFKLKNACIPTVVTTGADTGAGSLRYIIANACVGATITFAPGISQINLTSGGISMGQTLTIKGPGASKLTVNAAGNIYAFFCYQTYGQTVQQSISGLTISGAFDNNTYNEGSAGIVVNSGTVTLTNCVISNNNTSQYLSSQGGGIAVSGAATLNLNGCAVINNASYSSGGGIFNNGGNITIASSTIAGNQLTSTSGSQGGGIYNSSGTINITSSTIFGNSAQSGTNIYNADNTNNVSLGNSIIAGGVIAGTNTIGNDIAGNNFQSLDYNLIQDPSAVTLLGITADNITGLSPDLLAISNYGGMTSTMLPMPNSPVINKGSTTLLSSASDQRGYTRVAGGRADIGAVETNYVSAINAGSPQSAVIGAKFATDFKSKVTESGNAIGGINVYFYAPASGASGSFTGGAKSAVVPTISSGIAKAPDFTADSLTGTYSVTDSIGTAIPNLSFSLTNTPKKAKSVSDVGIGSFSATTINCATALDWQTTGEPDSNSFLLEASVDQVNYTTIYSVAETTDDGLQHSYHFTHSAPAVGMNYYRLIQKAGDGTITQIASSQSLNNCGNPGIQVFPNPAHDRVLIALPFNEKQTITINDVTGRRVAQYENFGSTFEMSVSNLSGGVYIIVVLVGNKIFTAKIVKY
jgi:Subtilase family/Secretion system C-terminal sorting domain